MADVSVSQDPKEQTTPSTNSSADAGTPPQGQQWGAPQPTLTLPGGRTVNPWVVLLSIISGFFMSLLDATIVNIALPSIQSNLSTDLSTVSWVINAYSIVFAVLLVTMGRFADQFGRKRMFMIGMVLFSVGSLACALAPSIGWLIAARAFQGIGAATLNPISLAIITAVFPPQKRGAAIGIWGALAGLAAAIGPVLGGFLLEAGKGNLEWRWIFFVNLPFCVIGLFLTWRNVPETRDLNTSKRIDVLGLATLSIGLFCLILAITEGGKDADWDWLGVREIGLYVGAVVGLLAFYFVETRQKEPILDFGLFRIRSFSAANLGTFMFSVASTGVFLMLVLYFQNALGYNALDAAYAVLPLPLASFVIAAVSGRLSGRFEPRFLAMLGLLLLGVGLLLLYTVGADTDYIFVAFYSALTGAGLGFCFTSFPGIVLAEVPRAKYGVASGAFNTARQIGFTIGVAILISLFTSQLKPNLTTARDNSIAIVRADTKLPSEIRDRIVTGLQRIDPNNTDRNSSNASVNLVDQVKRIPGIPAQAVAAITPELEVLNGKIGHEFKSASISAFNVTWFASAMFALFGIIPAFFAFVPRAARGHNPEAAAAAA